METPEEFVCRIRDRYEDSFTMDWDDAEKEVLTRDAAIRQECAKRAVKWLNNVKAGIYDDSLLTTIIGKEGEE